MQNNSSRQDILQAIATAPQRRSACVDSLSEDLVYKDIKPDAVTCFKEELEAVSGQCFLCENELDLYAQLKKFVMQNAFPFVYCRDSFISGRLEAHGIPFSNTESDFEMMQAGITDCEFLVARTASVLISSASPSGRQMTVFPPVHIVLAHVSQLVDYPADAFAAIRNKYADALPSIISTVTGPSRTADIEKTLVLGAHGPKEFVVFLCKE